MNNKEWFKHFNLITYDKIDSTNQEALRIFCSKAKGDFVIVANEQFEGRGRNKNEWHSPSGNLYFSILLQKNIDVNLIGQLSLISSIDLVKALKKVANLNDLDIFCKWPNDILIGNKKLAGVLLEVSTSINQKNSNYVIIGIGINLNSFPKLDVGYEATSIKKETGQDLEIYDLLNSFMELFHKSIQEWTIMGFAKKRQEWNKYSLPMGVNISVTQGVDKIHTIYHGIDEVGNLLIRNFDGKIEAVNSAIITGIDK